MRWGNKIGDYIILAVVVIACLIFPITINTLFNKKYHHGALVPVPIILSSIGLFSIVMAYINGDKLELAILFTIIMYIISVFLVKKSAEELGCTTGDTVKMILANALIPAGIILAFLILLTMTSNKKGKRKRRNGG